MAYTTNGMIDGPCPEGFPRRLPEAQIFVRINNYDSTNKSYQLSDASNIFHADFFKGWQEGTLQQIIDNCEVDDSINYGYNPPCGCKFFFQVDTAALFEIFSFLTFLLS